MVRAGSVSVSSFFGRLRTGPAVGLEQLVFL